MNIHSFISKTPCLKHRKFKCKIPAQQGNWAEDQTPKLSGQLIPSAGKREQKTPGLPDAWIIVNA